jgi:ABC-type polysaccharide/polyol phosphate transport system ATPase subunit
MINLTFDHASKRYRVRSTADANRGRRSLKQKLQASAAGPTSSGRSATSRSTWRRETLGISGHNGAGKSTILKVLSSVTAPSGGEITIRGRLSALIEVGVRVPSRADSQNTFPPIARLAGRSPDRVRR